MTSGLAVAALAFVSIGFSQSLPSYQLMQEVDASGMDSLAGLGTDAHGNVYLAGSTSSPHFPVKNAVQAAIASSGLYRISGAVYTALGLSSCSAVALDPQNPAVIFAISKGVLVKSANSGVAFGPTTLPSSQVNSVAIQPGNDQILYAGTGQQGVFKSTDGGATWTASPPEQGELIAVNNLWIDPKNVSVILAGTPTGLVRSGDGGASWQPTTITGANIQSVSFDASNAGVLYVTTSAAGLRKSTDDGLTFAPFTVPMGIFQVVTDPIQSARLIGLGTGIYQSTDGGITWTQQTTTAVYDLVADTLNGVYYAAMAGSGIVRISANLQNVTPVDPALPTGNLTALAVMNGQVYEANSGSEDVFVTKLDPLGNIFYSTYLGGTGNDQAVSMTVDAQGNVFVTGTTGSADFPVSSGAYASSGSVFLFRLNPDGSLAWSTYFTGTRPVAVATDGNGSAWLLGNTEFGIGAFPVTPGTLAATFCCLGQGGIGIGPPIIPEEATLTRFAPSGSSLTFSTYVAGSGTTSALGSLIPAGALAVAPDDSAYVGGFAGFFRIDPTGSTLLSSMTNAPVNPQAMALGPDGSLYAAGMPENFQATAGAFQTTPPPIPNLPSQGQTNSETGIVRIDPTLKSVLAATLFGTYEQVKVMTTDAAGNLYIGGSTASIGLPTRTPFAGGFASPTGFMSELSADLSSLLFSSYFGDTENFTVAGVGIGLNGSVWIGGATNQTASFLPDSGSGNVWVNSLALTLPPPLRIDSVENAASMLDGPIAAGETIVVNGAGFGGKAQLTIGGEAVSPLAITPTTITAVVPASVPAGAAAVEVQSGGANSNSVLIPVAVTAPGIFSQDGTGYGQGYILNEDGTLNSPSNPAASGDRITIFATGVGPLSFTQCCAVAEYPVNVYIDSVYCDGVAAIVGQVNGLPGSAYQITVYVPNPTVLFANTDPGFVFPPLAGVVMRVNGTSSQPGIAIAIGR